MGIDDKRELLFASYIQVVISSLMAGLYSIATARADNA
jgi:hypothetical protein